MAKPMAQAATLVVHTGRWRMSARSTSGSTTRSSQRAHTTAKTADSGEEPEHAGRGPAPGVALADRQQQRQQREREQRAADPVDARAHAHGRLGHPAATSRARRAPWSTTESQKIQEIEPWSTKSPASTSPVPPPIPNIADTVPIAGATRSRGNSSRMMPMASGKIAPPAPWMARPAIEHGQRAADGGDQRADAEDGQRDEQPALLAVHVAQAAEQRRGDRRGEQEGGQQPGGVGRAGVELVLQLGQRRDDHGLRQRVGQRGAGQRQQGARRRLHRRPSTASARRSSRRAASRRSPALSEAKISARRASPRARAASTRVAPVVGEGDVHHAPVGVAWHALDEALALESGEHAGRGRRADPGGQRELAGRQALAVDQRLEQVVLREAELVAVARRPRMRRVARRNSSSAAEKASCSVSWSAPDNP